MNNSAQNNLAKYTPTLQQLCQDYGFKEEDAKKYLKKYIAGRVSSERACQRLRVVSREFKRVTAARFLKKNPLAIQLPLENLPSVLKVMQESMLPSDVLFLIMRCPFILLCAPECLQLNSQLLRAKLYSQGLYVGFIKYRPEIFIFPPEVLQKRLTQTFWVGSKKDFWRQIMGLPRKTDEPRVMRAMEASKIAERMVARGESKYAATNLSRHLARIFGESAFTVYELFEVNCWTAANIQELDRNDRKWREDPAQLISNERALLQTGLMPTIVRQLLLKRSLFMYVPKANSCRIIKFFRNKGFDDDIIFAIAMRRPGLFNAPIIEVQRAYDKAQKERKGLLWNTCKSAIIETDS